jgi:hypothetical protein
VSLLSPDIDDVIADPIATLELRVEDDTYVRSVSVNGVDVPLRVSSPSVTKDFEVTLTSGNNEVEIQAVDIVGNRTVSRQVLRSDLEGPAVSFDDVAGGGVGFSGVIADASDVDYMRIGGTSAALAAEDDHVRFQFPSGTNGPDVEFECADVFGNVTRGTVAPRTVVAGGPNGSPYVRFVGYDESDMRRLQYAAVELGSSPRSGAPSPQIEFTNLREGQRYLQPEVIVGLLVRSPDPVAGVQLNGNAITQLLSDRRVQHVTSKIALNDLGPQEILATASDLEGRTWETHVSIERALPAVYDVSNRLSVAIVGSLWRSGDDADSSLRDYLLRELTRSLRETNRFRILDRDTIADVLQEQELVAALGSPEERRNLGQLNLADYLLVADVRRFDSNLEVLVHAIDPATGRDIVMDVYGPAESPGELTELLEELALRVYQEFPRVQGEVISVMGGGSRVRTTVQKNDRVRESSSCLLYREKEVIDVQTGQFLGMDLQPVASGVFTSIGGSRSTVTVDSASQLAEDTDLVITR